MLKYSEKMFFFKLVHPHNPTIFRSFSVTLYPFSISSSCVGSFFFFHPSYPCTPSEMKAQSLHPEREVRVGVRSLPSLSECCPTTLHMYTDCRVCSMYVITPPPSYAPASVPASDSLPAPTYLLPGTSTLPKSHLLVFPHKPRHILARFQLQVTWK